MKLLPSSGDDRNRSGRDAALRRPRPRAADGIADDAGTVALSIAPLNAARTAQRAVPTRSRQARYGFTLIEMMVVLIVIAITAAVIIPEMRGTYEDELLRSTSRELANACSLASSRAISFNQPHRLRLNLATGKYSIEKRVQHKDDEEFVPLRDVPGSEGELDTRIAIEFRRADEGSAEESASVAPSRSSDDSGALEPGEVINFYPDGTADDGFFLLQDRAGFRLALRVNPITARVQVIELAHE